MHSEKFYVILIDFHENDTELFFRFSYSCTLIGVLRSLHYLDLLFSQPVKLVIP